MLIYYLFQNGILFKWTKYQQKIIDLLKKQLKTALTLKLINYYKGADDIIFAVDINDYKWKTVLIQYTADSKQKQHSIKYENRVWNPQKAVYNMK